MSLGNRNLSYRIFMSDPEDEIYTSTSSCPCSKKHTSNVFKCCMHRLTKQYSGTLHIVLKHVMTVNKFNISVSVGVFVVKNMDSSIVLASLRLNNND